MMTDVRERALALAHEVRKALGVYESDVGSALDPTLGYEKAADLIEAALVQAYAEGREADRKVRHRMTPKDAGELHERVKRESLLPNGMTKEEWYELKGWTNDPSSI